MLKLEDLPDCIQQTMNLQNAECVAAHSQNDYAISGYRTSP